MKPTFLLSIAMVFALNVHAQSSSEQASSASDSTSDVEEVLVVGEQPGPGLWQIRKGENVVWVLGMLSPLPKNMQWHSKKVESVVANSQELIMPAEVKLQVGFWSKVGLLPSLIGIKNNPNGKKLADVLPPELYARWASLKQKYCARDCDIEKQRPIFAVTELFKESIEKSDMVSNSSVRWVIEGIVRTQHIKTTRPVVDHELTNPHAAIKKFKKSSLDDTECFARTIGRLETDLDGMRARANAWSTGDIDALRALPYIDDKTACEEAVLNSELAQDQGLQDIKAEMKDAWLAAIESALQNNASTFAILPMDELLNANGYLAALTAKGYVVEAPN